MYDVQTLSAGEGKSKMWDVQLLSVSVGKRKMLYFQALSAIVIKVTCEIPNHQV